jgi:hypothetical protein
MKKLIEIVYNLFGRGNLTEFVCGPGVWSQFELRDTFTITASAPLTTTLLSRQQLGRHACLDPGTPRGAAALNLLCNQILYRRALWTNIITDPIAVVARHLLDNLANPFDLNGVDLART